jgi:hypothetical protein
MFICDGKINRGEYSSCRVEASLSPVERPFLEVAKRRVEAVTAVAKVARGAKALKGSRALKG